MYFLNEIESKLVKVIQWSITRRLSPLSKFLTLSCSLSPSESIEVLDQGPWGGKHWTVKKQNKNTNTNNPSSCIKAPPPLGVSPDQPELCSSVLCQEAAWLESSKGQPKVGKRRFTIILCILWLVLSLLGHHRKQSLRCGNKELLSVSVVSVSNHHIHTWKSSLSRQRRDYDKIVLQWSHIICCTTWPAEWVVLMWGAYRWLRHMVVFPREGAVESFIERFTVLFVSFNSGLDHLRVRRKEKWWRGKRI